MRRLSDSGGFGGELEPLRKIMPEPERAAALGRIRAFLATRPETADAEFTLPMQTAVLRVRLL